ncbi:MULTISPECIES: hypothetical protein [Pseudomonas]|uniref:hypothetical protein n=1 Tax=Pseudomonas TaxID=286 RepID=UPI00224A87F7|nr:MULTISPECIES: hypothetical protein [Pseudomonas]MCX2814143.1 hypothetical protein [Pseudomonas sp. DCB_E]MCX9142429.1 hypothetical protein [Pseudomonas sp. DCB_Q]MDD2003880.1 hypothetical protein [Pseudomonas putida]
MSNDSARLLAAKARLDYQKQRVARLAAQRVDALAPPEAQGIVDPADGTLNKDVLDADLDVVIQEWLNLPDPILGDKDTLQLEMAIVDGQGVGDFLEVGASAQYDKDSVFPTTLQIPKADYPHDGKRQLRYRIDRYNTPTPEYSPAIDLIFDKTPPWDAVEPEAAALNGNVVTDAFFGTNPTGLTVTLPPYTDQDVKDTYALYYSDTVPVEGQIPPAIGYGPLPANRELLITKADIERLSDGHFYIVYILLDKATNRSRISKIAEVYVNLGSLPTALQAPVVPLAQGDGLIDLADAQAGITVEVDYTNYRRSDIVEVTWGTSKPFTEEIGSREPPLSISVPHDRLREAYGAADTELETDVSYRVLRHGVPYGPESTTLKVDFSVAGPDRPDPDPTWPDPINSKLDAPAVWGKNSQQENVLDRSDTGEEATFKVKRHDDAKDTDIMEFYWAGTLVTEATYSVDLSDPADIERPLPWTYILNASNNPTLPVHYTIRKATGAGNEQNSPTAVVNANAVVIEPDAPEFQRLYNNRFLNCESLWEDPLNPTGDPAFKVFVPPLNQYLPNGGEVTLTWTGWGGYTGDNEIPAARLTEARTISAAEAAAGFYWEVKPYSPHILSIYDPTGHGADGRGRVQYSFQHGGETVTSKTAEAVVSLGTGSGTCAIP